MALARHVDTQVVHDMPEYSLYIDKEDAFAAEEEERDRFIRDTLIQMGLPIDEIWEKESLSVEEKIELRKVLRKFDVEIITDNDRCFEIYYDKEVVGRWYKPRFVLRRDMSEIRPSKQIYYEMIVQYESMFDEDHQEEEDE